MLTSQTVSRRTPLQKNHNTLFKRIKATRMRDVFKIVVKRISRKERPIRTSGEWRR